MKILRIILIVVAGLFLVFLAFLKLITAIEVTSINYSSYAQAKAAGAIGEAKWLPIWLPTSAFEIKESHDVDTNESWLKFNFTPPITDINRWCKPTIIQKVKTLPEKSRIKFKESINLAAVVSSSGRPFEFYRCWDIYSEERFLVIDTTGKVGHSWMLSR